DRINPAIHSGSKTLSVTREGFFMADAKQGLLEQADLNRTLGRMAHEIIEKSANPEELVLIGIRSRGVHLARRLARKVDEICKFSPPVAVIDVTGYRDDRAHELGLTHVGAFEIQATVDDTTVDLIVSLFLRSRTH